MRKPEQQPRLSFRQVKIARERAKDALARFLYGPKATLGLPDDPASASELADFTTIGKQILSAIARENDPPEAALRALVAALNQPVKEFNFRFFGKGFGQHIYCVGANAPVSVMHVAGPGVFEDHQTLGPYNVKMHPVRYRAEALREYLQLTPICGLIHSACEFEGCTNVVFGGRGNKKFCSDEHRKAFWTYDRQREYFQQKQRKTYRVRKMKGVKKHGSVSSRKKQR